MRGKAVTVNVRMPKAAKGKKRSRRGPYQTLKSTGWVRGSADSVARFGPTRVQATPEQLAMRKAWHYTGNGLYAGRGGFWGDLWNKTSGIRHALGGAARGGMFGPLGQAVGGVTGALGIGDYSTGEHVVSNNIVDEGKGQGIPEFGHSPNTITVQHKEYIGDIFGPQSAGTFQNQTFGLNPGLQTTFPWLAQVAANYDEYTFHQLIFTYRSTVTDFVAGNGQVGSVIMATQYNSNEAPFASKQDAMEYDGAVSAKVSEKILHGVECDPTKLSGSPGKYTRAGPVPQGEDKKTYDLGQLNISVSNTPAGFANQAIGELWVSYTVELRKPKFFATRGLAIQRDAFVGREPTTGTPDFLANLTMGQAQQCRIGGQLVKSYVGIGTVAAPQYAADKNKLYYIFPATFSGDIEVKCVSYVGSAGDTGLTCTVPTAPNDPAIEPINDFWNENGWTNRVGSELIEAGTFNSCWVAHHRVTSPATAQTAAAQDNVLVITGVDELQSYHFEVAVYNTGLNNIRTDQMVIEDPATSLVISWNAGP